jgi:MFS family permease
MVEVANHFSRSLATLACGLAINYATLLVARGLAGVFGGVLGSMVQTLLADAIPYPRRAAAGGLVATAFSVSTVAGVPLSLWLAEAWGWRVPFLFLISNHRQPSESIARDAVRNERRRRAGADAAFEDRTGGLKR